MTLQKRRKRKASRGRILLLVLSLSLCVVLGSAVVGLFMLFPADNRIARGVRVAGVSVSGMTQAEARQALATALAHDDTPITLSAGPRERTVTLAELGIAPDAEALARGAYLLGRQGSYLFRVAQLLHLRSHALVLPPAYFFNAPRADTLLRQLAHRVNRLPLDATGHWDDAAGKLVVTPGHAGAKLDIPASRKLIQALVAGDLAAGRPVPDTLTLPYRAKVPRITPADLAPVDAILGSFTTAYASASDRGSNVKTAAEAINGVVLAPDEVFSFNQTVGPRSTDNGYLTAPVIIDGQLHEGTGGGVCQVSTTLYNAVLLADLHVTRRSHHSLPSHYVAAGRDATVSYGHIDFRFKNTTDAPIVIEAHPGVHHLTVRILGQGPAPVVHIVTSDRQAEPGRTITRDDPDLPKGEKKIENGTGGLSITVSRVIGDGADATTEVISHDRYAGEPTVIHVGSGAGKAKAEAGPADAAAAEQ